MAKRLGLVAAIVLAVCPPIPTSAHTTVAPRAPLVSSGAWTTYHHDNAHTGYDPSAPTLGTVQVTPGWTNTTLDGEIYASPLIFNGIVYAATLSNTIYALNQATGAMVWSKNVGAPTTGGWACGNISPTGILGTPVIDTAANRIYAVAEIDGTTPTYHLFGLDLAVNGNIVLDTPIAPPGFDWTIQQQRGALALSGGNVYIPFGGRAGDCGGYHGYVVGAPTSGAAPAVYQTPDTGSGIWSSGGVVVDDSTGKVFVSTGNGVGSGCSSVNQNDAVLRLSAGLVLEDWFMPNDWQANWCQNDQDLGSAAPVLLSSSLLFMAGKWGTGFLLSPTALGGVDGQRFPTPSPQPYSEANVCLGNHSDATFGSFAYVAPFVYLECEGRGIVALNVNTATPSFTPCDTCGLPDWQGGVGITFGPPIVAAGAVWAASNSGLYAFDANTGTQIYHSSSFGINRFVTPAEAGGQVFVPSHTVVRSFSFGAVNSITLTPASLSFGGQAPTTTSAAQTVTLHNNQSVTLNVTAVAPTGANAANYLKGTDTCAGVPVVANGTCTVQVSFKPGTFGGFPANLSFTDNGPGSPQSVPLNGMGTLDNQTHLYTLDGWGGVHADGGAPSLNPSQYWPGWNIARSLALFPDGTGGYSLDGWGGLHPVGNADPVSASGYWPGWDIARQVVLAPWSSKASPAGWTLDGWGGIHEFGGAPQLHNYAWWPGWDIARGLVILPDSTPSSVAGYTLDGWGGLHPFGGAPVISNAQYWPGWDIARGIALSANASKTNPAGWTLDGWGGVHPFGNAPVVSATAYWPGWDIARGIVPWTGPGSGNGGWVMDGWGGIHSFGSVPTVSTFAYWGGWDIATSLAGPGFNSGSRRRT